MPGNPSPGDCRPRQGQVAAASPPRHRLGTRLPAARPALAPCSGTAAGTARQHGDGQLRASAAPSPSAPCRSPSWLWGAVWGRAGGVLGAWLVALSPLLWLWGAVSPLGPTGSHLAPIQPRGTVPPSPMVPQPLRQAPRGALSPGDSGVPRSTQPSTWGQPCSTSRVPGEPHQARASRPLASPRIGDRLIKCVILNYPDKSVRAFKVNSLNIIMKRAFLCSR